MPTFVLTYRPPTGYQAGTPEGMAAWDAWFHAGDNRTTSGTSPGSGDVSGAGLARSCCDSV